jgi:hypothetical protein
VQKYDGNVLLILKKTQIESTVMPVLSADKVCNKHAETFKTGTVSKVSAFRYTENFKNIMPYQQCSPI